MADCNALMLVCDEAQVSITSGKYNYVGVYNADLGIPREPQTISQLVFLFIIDADMAKRPPVVTIEVTLPGEQPKQLPIPIPPTIVPLPGRSRMGMQVPFAITSPVLRAGRIEARVIYGEEIVPVRGPWITITN